MFEVFFKYNDEIRVLDIRADEMPLDTLIAELRQYVTELSIFKDNKLVF